MKKDIKLILSIVSLIVLVLTKQIDFIDRFIYQEIQRLQTPFLTKLICIITNLGSGKFYAICILLMFFYKRKPAIKLTLAMLFSYSIGTFIKMIIQRPRPLEMLILETGFSFPSNHTLNAVVFYSCIALLVYKKKDLLQKILLAIPLIIGFTRIYLHVHFFSDVLGGYLIGLLLFYYINIIWTKFMVNYKQEVR